MGYQLSAAANHGAGHENSDRISYQESTVNAGNNATLTSGRDTTLTGAQVSGKHITAEVGRHLTLTSQQDREEYDLRQHNESIAVAGGSSGINGSINVSQQKMDSQYQSVNEQTGLFAGKEGFAIKVGQHSQLNGAVIGSTAAQDKNTLATGTLGFSDIENSAHYHSEQQGIGLSTGGTVAGQFIGNMANSLLTGTNHGDSDSSTTQSAISQGDIQLTDKANQQQDLATLSRDVEHANQSLSPIFNKEKEQRRLATAQLIGQIGSQASDILRTQGKIYATQAGQEALAKQGIFQPDSNASSEKKAAYQQRLTASTAYQQAQANYGTGSSLQRAMQAATLALQGLAGSDLKAAIAAGSSPYLAEIIKNNTPNDGARVIAHAVVNAVLASAQGNSAAAGAAGAAVGEMTGILASNLYQTTPDKLTEEQKQTISALATLASGLSGAIIGNGTADAVAGAQAGKTTVENNFLNSNDVLNLHKELENADKTGADKQSIYEKYGKISKKNREEAVAKSCSDNPFCANGILAEAEAGSDIAATLKRLPIFSDLNSDDLSQLYQFVLAENEESAKAIYQAMPDYVKVALYTKEVGETLGLGVAIGGKGMAALGIIGKNKVGKGSAIPVPEPMKAKNGLTYKSNPKHTLGGIGNRPDAGIEPKNSLSLFENSVSLSIKGKEHKARYTMDDNGNIHRFSPDNLGGYHWSGSTADKKNKLELPNDVRAALRKQERWKIK